MSLPDATAKPCSDCPWRRVATQGWLGPLTPEMWVEGVHSDAPIACHQTIVRVGDDGLGSWDDPAMRQCRGAAIFRANVCKMPRDTNVVTGPADEETVFASNAEFLAHHEKKGLMPDNNPHPYDDDAYIEAHQVLISALRTYWESGATRDNLDADLDDAWEAATSDG